MTYVAWLLVVGLAAVARAGEPVFDPSTLMRLVLVPADAAVGSVIYRVRASDPDFDYPLQFELIGQMGRLDVGIETLPCTRYNSVCQANVILLRRLEPGRYVDFRLSVRNTRGRSSRIGCSITGTNATTPRDTIFPHQPSIILAPEDAKRGTDLEIVIARKNPVSPKPLELELWGSPLFAIRQRRVSTENTEGTIFLVGPLDFEAQSMYHLTLLAVDPYVEIGKDTRNIAALEVVVVVQDVQDMPPVFTFAPPITHLPKQVVPGDVIVKVRAEDGDKGAPRHIRYGLVSEGNPFTPYFNINETTGEVTLERPVEEIAAISHAGAPILLTVVAEEVRVSREEPEAMSSTVQLAFILPERDNSPPYFENQFYITYLDENAPQGTALTFNDPYIPQVNDNDSGKNGVFSLSLLGNNGTFEITPTVAERHAQFMIKVRDNVMLDYEARKSVIFQIVAQELGPATNLTATANVTVYLNDVNDNPPIFLDQSYEAELPENITAGARVVQVAADDVDTGAFGKIQFTAILGYLNTSLHLDPISGMITVATNNHGFDREAMPDLHFLVEARDNEGVGLRVTVPLIIKLLDVNDNPPEFERSLYEFVLSPSLNNFTSSAFVKAIDKDAEAPNNVVRYEITEGNKEGKFSINEETGELYLLETLKRSKKQNVHRQKRQFDDNEQESEVYVLTVKAYDMGVPRLYSSAMVKIYPPESKTKTMSFIVPGAHPDRKKLEEVLSTLSGGKVTIVEIKPYKGNDGSATDLSGQETSQEKSEVIAVVRMTGNTAINVAKLQEQLAKNKTIIYNTDSGHVDNTIHHHESSDNTLYKAESRLLFWLLILLAIIVALVLLLLICCCICEGCPLYMPPRSVTMSARPAAGAARAKKQNHANIPCPIENCARFTYGKLPDHLTKRHGLTGAERDALNEQQRKRFFNGELCQVRFLKESAIRDLWGPDYDDPRIRQKIHQSYGLVKIRIIPLAATQRARPLTEQDANVLTSYNARTAPRPTRVSRPRPRARPYPPPESTPAGTSSESSEGEENTRTSALPPSPPPSSPSLPPSPVPYELQPPVETRLRDIFDPKVDAGYKAVIDDMKKSMTLGRNVGPRKRKAYRTYRRYAKRLIAYLHRQHSPLAYDVDLLLCGERQVCAFLERVKSERKTKTFRNYIVAAIKLLDSRLFAIETDPGCKEKVGSMTRVYEALHRRLNECDRVLAEKNSVTHSQLPSDFDPDIIGHSFNDSCDELV